MQIPFSPPRIDDKIIAEVTAALKSGWITTGPRTKKFESKLSEYVGVNKTLALNSATAGLEIILRWFGVKAGDEVIIPAYTYCATANVVIHCGATPIMVDTNADDFNISVCKIEQAITPRTKVIMPVDFAGLPCDYDAINQLINRIDIKSKFNPESEEQKALGRILVLADAAHSLGATFNEQKANKMADIAVFSFHAVKNLTTAEGGGISFNLPPQFDEEAIYKYLCIKTLHGQSKDALAKTQRGNWRYDVQEAGYKFNMTDILAAIGLVELERYESDTLVKRKQIFEIYNNALKNKTWAILPISKTDKKETSYHLYPLRVKGISDEKREQIIQDIFSKDISVNVHFIPLPLMSFYANLGYKMDDYPVAYNNFCQEISLPVFYDLSTEQAQYVVDNVIESVEKFINE
jgi:dTDP-4-amino-4,6-dideoxygalactose transaminase